MLPPEESVFADVLARRYAGATVPTKVLGNDVIATVLAHRTVRAFTSDPLPDGTLETLVAAAQSASSSSNLHLWSLIAVTDGALKQQLSALALNQRHMVEAPLLLLWVTDLSRLTALGTREGAATDGLDYLETYVTAAIDAALAAQNAAVAAASLGLGIGYIGAMRNHPEDVAELIGLPPRAMVIFGLVVGWPDPARPASIKSRPAQAMVLHRDQYDNHAEEASIEDYDAAMRKFQKEQGMDVVGWKKAVLGRVANAAALTGRHRLGDALRKLGFQLS